MQTNAVTEMAFSGQKYLESQIAVLNVGGPIGDYQPVELGQIWNVRSWVNVNGPDSKVDGFHGENWTVF